MLNSEKEISPDKTLDTDWTLSSTETEMLTKLLLQKLQATEDQAAKLDAQLASPVQPAHVNSPSQPAQDTTGSFAEISASINEKLEILEQMSKDDSISEETPKESTKLSDQFSQATDSIGQFSSISQSDKSATPTNLQPRDRSQPTPWPSGPIQFGVAQSPVRLTADDIAQLPDVTDSTLNTSTSMEMTNQLVDWAIQHGIAQVRQTREEAKEKQNSATSSTGAKTPESIQSGYEEEVQNNTLDRLLDEDSGEQESFQPLKDLYTSMSTSLSSFLRNEAEMDDESDKEEIERSAEAVPRLTTHGRWEEQKDSTKDEIKPSRSASELLVEVEELHKSIEGNSNANTLERIETEETTFCPVELADESAAFQQLEEEIQAVEEELQEELTRQPVEPSSLSNIEEVTENESSKDATPTVPEPSSGAVGLTMQEAFLRRKKKFIENSEKRQQKVKGERKVLYRFQ